MPRTRVRSRLRFSNFREIDGISFWDLNDVPVVPEQGDDLLYTVQASDRIDALAARFYGDSILWPIIAVANDMELIPSDFNQSEEIRIPSPRYVRELLFQRPRIKF